MFEAGETPGKGIYICMVCGERVELKSDDEKLPLCPQCKASMYK
jgi:rubrerythrin